jgi:hypothetical protein
MAAFGGSQISLPTRRCKKGSALVRALGEESVRVLIELFGGEDLEVPKGNPRADALREAILEHSGSHNEVARELGISRRWVRMVRTANTKEKREALRRSFERDAERLKARAVPAGPERDLSPGKVPRGDSASLNNRSPAEVNGGATVSPDREAQ